jgi:hypothetical protein
VLGWKNGDNLSPSQRSKLAWVQRVNKPSGEALIALAMLALGAFQPSLPGRQPPPSADSPEPGTASTAAALRAMRSSSFGEAAAAAGTLA